MGGLPEASSDLLEAPSDPGATIDFQEAQSDLKEAPSDLLESSSDLMVKNTQD